MKKLLWTLSFPVRLLTWWLLLVVAMVFGMPKTIFDLMDHLGLERDD